MGTEREGAWCEKETGEAGRARYHRPCIHFRIWTFPRESSGNQRRATAEEWLDQTCLLKKSLWLQWRELIRKARGGCGEALVVCEEVLRERQQNQGEVNAFTRCLGGKHSGARCSRVREMRETEGLLGCSLSDCGSCVFYQVTEDWRIKLLLLFWGRGRFKRFFFHNEFEMP